jgi:hypothetical protein
VKEVLGLVEEARAVPGRRLGQVHREVPVPEILDERDAEVRSILVERGHAHARGAEGRADRGPVGLRGRGGLRIEDEEGRGAAACRLPEVAPRADIPGERRGRRCSGESEALPGASKTPSRVRLIEGGHPFVAGAGAAAGAAPSSRMSTFISFW